MLLYHSLAVGLTSLLPLATAQSALVGTWSSKSRKTLTGPGFFNPKTDTLIEPTLPGISYSFTADGHYEEAYYRAIANPTNPACPSGILQWQHGSFVENADGSLTLTPIAVDGRQLLSEPCDSSHGIYTRYNQTETMKSYETLTDPYHNVPRLNLYEFDGTPMMPLYQVYNPPQMLPTTTLNPLVTATATASSKKVKRGLEPPEMMVHRVDPQRFWWLGLALTGIGGLLYCYRS